MSAFPFEEQRVPLHLTEHRDGDDLLSAGMGLQGLRQPLPSLARVDAAELRRRAIHHNWNGIAHLGSDDCGWEQCFARPQPGIEVQTLLRLPGCQQPHRVLLQIPDNFDPAQPKLLATAASGSRGVYGALALAPAWGLQHGFAVVCTDKGCGSDWFDEDTASAPGLDGLLTADPALQAFHPGGRCGHPHAVQIKHVHSQDNPEQHWGASLNQAIRFAWKWMDAHFGKPMARHPRRRCLAVGLSNGGAAVLQAVQAEGLIDAAVAVAPNVSNTSGGSAFFDYLCDADLWMPLAQGAASLREAPCPVPAEHMDQLAARAHQELREVGLLRPMPLKVATEYAYRTLRRRGWPRATLIGARICTAFDFWRSGVIAYSHALGRFEAATSPLGTHYAMHSGEHPRAASELERSLWWSDSAGIVPGAGVGIVNEVDRIEVLRRVIALRRGRGAAATAIRAGVAAIRCGPPRASIPLLLVHGEDDGLIAPAFSSAPYYRMAQRAGADVQYWRVPLRPHFDAFLGLPGYGEHRRPLLPVAFRALDAMWQRLQHGTPIRGYSDD